MYFSGDDEGRVYAALITGAGTKSPIPATSLEVSEEKTGSKRKRRRRRRRRDHKRTTAESETVSSKSLACSHSRAADTSKHATDQSVTGSLGLLTAYSCSDTDSEDDDGGTSKPHNQLSSREKFAVPTSIQEMFEHEEPGPSKIKKYTGQERVLRSIGGDSTLGYFEADKILSSDDEMQNASGHDSVRGDALGSKTAVSDVVVSKKWNKDKARRKFGDSILSTYTCWKCSNVGHLAEDCTVAVKGGGSGPSGSGEGGAAMTTNRVRIPKSLQGLYAACRDVKSRKDQRCSDCGGRNNLAYCLDCK